ncbi:MFS transporter [Labilibaculum sp. DW002]|uniref:MFS transporter n=1 Tax=Paralabilibaculum antarcticum TaxID=2912572 RepID=A0ABT5VM72_9BACT|nr:MFS transporter [Labilibaculum sp. DW002]MDE5416524.1 MFS transporter [Labilibaculum sp. DW002]
MNKELRKNIMFQYLMLLVIAATAGHQAWRTLFNNLAVDEVGINGFQLGVIQSVREIPGFLALLVVYLLLVIKEHRLSALAVLFVGLGVALTGFFPSFIGLIATTLIMSIGFHYFETTNKSLTLQYFNYEQAPYVFAKQKSWAAVANIGVGAFIFGIAHFISLQANFILIGTVIFGLGVWALFWKPADKEIVPQNKGMVLRKRYWLFYVLNFLSGARRQIFVVFAVFMLVQKYHFSIQHVAILFIINNIITYFISPYIAKGINRYGERKMLSLEYIFLIFVFLGYAFIENGLVVAILYIIDHIFFGFSMGINTYFHKTGDKKDIAPSMAVGFTINHISAVVIPVCGGLLWMWHWQIPFIAGAILCVVSLAFVQKIRIQNKI